VDLHPDLIPDKNEFVSLPSTAIASMDWDDTDSVDPLNGVTKPLSEQGESQLAQFRKMEYENYEARFTFSIGETD
jgi:hypothetical protein